MFLHPILRSRCYLALPGDDPGGDGKPSRGAKSGQHQHPAEELPYKVELWDATGRAVELVLAVTASASIGYAAFYAATREHPDRQIILRHKNNVISRWAGGKGH